jgi:hypothetical protein
LFLCQCLIYPDYEIAQDIHIVDECLVRRVIRVEPLMDLSVREELGAHIIKMVTFLEMSEVSPQGAVVND